MNQYITSILDTDVILYSYTSIQSLLNILQLNKSTYAIIKSMIIIIQYSKFKHTEGYSNLIDFAFGENHIELFLHMYDKTKHIGQRGLTMAAIGGFERMFDLVIKYKMNIEDLTDSVHYLLEDHHHIVNKLKNNYNYSGPTSIIGMMVYYGGHFNLLDYFSFNHDDVLLVCKYGDIDCLNFLSLRSFNRRDFNKLLKRVELVLCGIRGGHINIIEYYLKHYRKFILKHKSIFISEIIKYNRLSMLNIIQD